MKLNTQSFLHNDDQSEWSDGKTYQTGPSTRSNSFDSGTDIDWNMNANADDESSNWFASLYDVAERATATSKTPHSRTVIVMRNKHAGNQRPTTTDSADDIPCTYSYDTTDGNIVLLAADTGGLNEGDVENAACLFNSRARCQSDILPFLKPGDLGSDSDMIIGCRDSAADAASRLRVGDGAFLRRRDGCWRYAVVFERSVIERSHGKENTIRFQVNPEGWTKVVQEDLWGIRIRRIKKNEEFASLFNKVMTEDMHRCRTSSATTVLITNVYEHADEDALPYASIKSSSTEDASVKKSPSRAERRAIQDDKLERTAISYLKGQLIKTSCHVADLENKLKKEKSKAKKLIMDNEKLQQDLEKEGRRVLLRTLATKETSRSVFHYRS